jgi:bacteriocin biosynthesis cyclodehydratase domain-containing protein
VLPRQLRALLAPELAAASLAHGDSDGGARTLARRQAAHVRIMGGGRLEPGITRILTASGIGRVDNADALGRGTDTPGQGADGRGQGADARGRGSATTPSGQVRGPAGTRSSPARAAREHTTRARGTRPDLAVLIGIPGPELAARLMRERIPHLAVSASEAIGVVGPLVLPGRSACLRCLDLARTDRDPAWPLILAQLASRPADPPACDAALAAAVAAHATAQALAFIDRPAQASPVTNGTLELVLPAWQWRRRTWPPHLDCACGRRAPA